MFLFYNACAIQINLGTNYLLKKIVLEKMGYWQKESEFGKKVCCFRAPLGSLGLKTSHNHTAVRCLWGNHEEVKPTASCQIHKVKLKNFFNLANVSYSIPSPISLETDLDSM